MPFTMYVALSQPSQKPLLQRRQRDAYGKLNRHQLLFFSAAAVLLCTSVFVSVCDTPPNFVLAGQHSFLLMF